MRSAVRVVVCVVVLALATGLVPALSTATSTAASTAGDEVLTARLDRARTLTGRDVAVTGRTTPRAGVRLEERRGDRWVTRRSERADRAGRFSLRVAALAVGRFTYRVVAGDATSEELVVRVRGRGQERTWQTRYGRLHRWDPCDVITYRVNPRWARPSWRRDVSGAVRRVARQSGLRFRYLGSTRLMPQPGTTNPPGVDLVIAYARPRDTRYLQGRHRGAVGTSDTARLEVPTVDGVQRALGNGRVVVSTDWLRFMPRGFGRGVNRPGWTMGTRGRLLMHELGHVVGLGHVDSVGRSQHHQVMYPFLIGRLAAWGAGDATGFARVGAEAGCFAPAPDRARSKAVVVRRSSPVAEPAGLSGEARRRTPPA